MIGDHASEDLDIYEKTDNSIYVTQKPFGNVVLLPCLKQNHWRLLVLRILQEAKQVKVTLLDPYDTSEAQAEGKIALQKLKKFARRCEKNSTLHNLRC